MKGCRGSSCIGKMVASRNGLLGRDCQWSGDIGKVAMSGKWRCQGNGDVGEELAVSGKWWCWGSGDFGKIIVREVGVGEISVLGKQVLGKSFHENE